MICSFTQCTRVKREGVTIKVADKLTRMQIDTGASVSVVPKEPCNLKLRMYGGNSLTVTGKLSVPVEYNAQRKTLPLIVVKAPGGNITPLLGRDWLEELKLDWSCINRVREEKEARLLEK